VTVIALASAKGSPGVTTATLALAATWPGRALLVEADPAGGDVLAGYGRGELPPAPGLLELATAARRELTPRDLLARSRPLDDQGRLRLLAGVTGPAQLATVEPAWPAIGAACAAAGAGEDPWDVLVDLGRCDATGGTVGLLAFCDLLVVVARPTLRQVRHVRTTVGALRNRLADADRMPGLGLLLVGDAPYPAREVAGAVGAPVLAVLAADPGAAAVLSDGAAPGRGFTRSPLLRSARHAAAALLTAAAPGPAGRADEVPPAAQVHPVVPAGIGRQP
jgi:MinD-like ATPase involved in chromosome partitioning or flagellar assembly